MNHFEYVIEHVWNPALGNAENQVWEQVDWKTATLVSEVDNTVWDRVMDSVTNELIYGIFILHESL